jgi:hypothetical protein
MMNYPVPASGRAFRFLGFIFLSSWLAGCATTATQVSQVSKLESMGNRPKILLMTPDVKYYVLTAGGVTEPQADWTAAARRNFNTAITSYADERGADLATLPDDGDPDPLVTRYEKLHGAVGSTILANYYGMAKLPGKAGAFDWSLGPGISEIRDSYAADYALFSFYRDYQASGGRIAFAVLAAAAGAAMTTTAEFGFASLVDLKTGNVVWFNQVGAGVGELRDEDGAMAVIRNLFRDLPQG